MIFFCKEKKISGFFKARSSCQHRLSYCSFLCTTVLMLLLWEISVDCLWKMQKENNRITSKGNAFSGTWPLSFCTSDTVSSSVLYRMRRVCDLKFISCVLTSDFTRKAKSYFSTFSILLVQN